MRFPTFAAMKFLRSVDRGRGLLAGFNLVAGLVITTLLILNVKNTPYPTAVGIARALLVGGSLTCVTVWASLCFGDGRQPEGPCGGEDRREDNGRES